IHQHTIVCHIISYTITSILTIRKCSVPCATEKGHSHGTLRGVGIGGILTSRTNAWNAFQALGNIAFAYSFSMFLIEIQDTEKSPPTENKTMRKASTTGVSVTTLFYMSVGCAGYAAFGKHTPGNLLTGFGFYNLLWLVDMPNICVVFCQPLYGFVEEWSSNTYGSRVVSSKMNTNLTFMALDS
ncbi:hypothetical protein KI387_009352, partial [Taxus chinensis]